MTTLGRTSHGRNPRRRADPPVVYLPCASIRDDRPEGIRLLRLHDGRRALVGYSALDRLADACGDAQPWVLLTAADVARLRHDVGADLALLDVPLPSHLRAPT